MTKRPLDRMMAAMNLPLAPKAVGRASPGLTVALTAAWILGAVPAQAAGDDAPLRHALSLDGSWQFQREGAPANQWKTVQVPSTFQEHEGNDFHGVGWYRREVPPFELPSGKRALLHFEAAATVAEVWWNGERVGRHLGGWTPFRLDVTDLVRQAASGKPHELRVRLDERVGHNTQGFLTIIEPHFGGLWQEVKLLVVPDAYLDDLRLLAHGNPRTQTLELQFALAGNTNTPPDTITLRRRDRGETAWRTETTHAWPGGADCHLAIPSPNTRAWSPEAPRLEDLEIEARAQDRLVDRVAARVAFRETLPCGDHLRFNGRPLSVRGVLNWGYYPPRLAPHPDEARFRRDLEFARAAGFNLMKFCLWVPPRRYLELCDELGVLAWMEYPTWHPQLTAAHRDDLRGEFLEFFHHDRNHPSVILRSLTCETGAGADLAVIRELYDLAHREIPGAVVEDDSSWIGWNRIHDFYDDHPYGNNHTWVPTLTGFREHILAHGPKPLVLGECMAADTWFDRKPLLERVATNRPYWVPGFFEAMGEWEASMERRAGRDGLLPLAPDSRHYAMLMRKYQVEALRRELPYGGYVVSVLRDFSTAAMGLLDYADQPKWTAADWAWQGETMCLLATEHDRRSYFGGEAFRAEILLSHFGAQPLPESELSVVVCEDAADRRVVHRVQEQVASRGPGTLARVARFDFHLAPTETPRRLLVRAQLKSPSLHYENLWPIWLVPRPAAPSPPRVWLHPSLSDTLARELFPEVPRSAQPATGQVAVATRFDDALVGLLERGARVLLLPDGERGSFPLSDHWFLRGAPYVPGLPLSQCAPHAFWIELQHFDLAGKVIPELGYLDEIDPALLLWDTHDLKTVKTHGLLFETRAGEGRLLVSALRHQDAWNAAGQWLLSRLVDRLARGPAPQRALTDATWRRLKERLHEERLDLTTRRWRFRPDPNEEGLAQGWASPAFGPDASWKDIQVGQAWESQGFPALDHWAWYRLSVEIPAAWQGRSVYLNFEGVDDMYELYLDGSLVARRGDIAARKDTFNEKFSHDLSALVKPGKNHLIAVRVYDWYGAGGIFRPVTLSTVAFNPTGELLK
jgi:hypothetical protein